MKEKTKELFDAIEDNDSITLSHVANSLGISLKQLTNYRDGKRELTFSSLIKLTQIVCPAEAHSHISDWCMDFVTTDTISNAFAYAATKRDTVLLEKLVEAHKDADAKIAQCATVYEFILRYIRRDVSKFNMTEEISNLKYIKNPSLALLLDIYRLIAQFHKQEFQNIPSTANELLIRIDDLNDKKQGFLKECYLHLVAEVLAVTYLHFNNLEKARKYSQIVINAGANYRSIADAYYVLSLSYLSEDEAKCIDYMAQSYEYSRLTGDSNIERDGLYNLHFAQLLLGQDLPENAEPALIYYEKFRKGQVTKAQAEGVIVENGDKDLLALFRGISEGIDGMYLGYQEFVSNGNMYYACVILQEIVKAGENSIFVRGLAKMCFKNNSNKGDDLFEETYIKSFGNSCSCGAYTCA